VSSLIRLGLFYIVATLCGVIAGKLEQLPTRGGCGPTSLYVLAYMIHPRLAYPDVSRLFPHQGDIATMSDIQLAGKKLGVQLSGYLLDLNVLRQEKPLGIVHLDGTHFAAVVGYSRCGPLVADPVASGHYEVALMPYQVFSIRWDGAMLVWDHASLGRKK